MQGLLDSALILLCGLAAGLAVVVGLGLGLLCLGCIGAFLFFLGKGWLVLAATQAPAILAMGLAVWGCWLALRKELRVLDAVLKQGEPQAPPRLDRTAKLRLIGLNAAAIALCGFILLSSVVLFRKALKLRPSGPVTPPSSSESA